MNHISRFFTPEGDQYILLEDGVASIRRHHDGKIDEICTGPLGSVMAMYSRLLRESYEPSEAVEACTEVEVEEIAKLAELEVPTEIVFTNESLPVPNHDQDEITPQYRVKHGRNWWGRRK